MTSRVRVAALLTVLVPCAVRAQERPKADLSLEMLYLPGKRVPIIGSPSTQLAWLPDGALVRTDYRRDGSVSLVRVDPKTWKEEPLFPAQKLAKALVDAGLSAERAASALAGSDMKWNERHSAFVVDIDEDLYFVDVDKASARRLTSAEGSEDEPSFSPDGTKVAFLRGNDLYVVDVASARETRLTTGGTETTLNGRLDWVYQEEVYGRGDWKAFWWAPGSDRLAYLSLDEAKVPVYTLNDDRFQPQRKLCAHYPKAGDPNPTLRLGVVDLAGKTAWTDDPFPGKETLIVQVGWDPKGRLLASFQDRVQTWLDLRVYDGAASTSLVREESPAWQERLPLPVFLDDGGFLWQSDRDGYRHIYRYDAAGKLLNAVTKGAWCVEQVHGVDKAAGRVFFDATERSFTGLDAYSVGLDGSGMRRVTERKGTHFARFSPDFSWFLDYWSDVKTPFQQALHDGNGGLARVIDANPSLGLTDYRLGEVRLRQVPARDGFPMETMLVLPPEFDPKKTYPVVQHIYGGPGFPGFRTHEVRDFFSRTQLLYHFLAERGYVVWICDNRLASGKGAAAAHSAWKQLFVHELEDQLDGLAWLRAQGFADMSRVAIEGWSYGGSMAAYALTHSTAWKIGIAGAPGTDWRLYDTIYTERFMGLPKDNPEGYDRSSIVRAAPHLGGKLLILHGTLDDNVHPQNTIQFIDAAQKAFKSVDLVLLPGSSHGPEAPYHVWAQEKATWDFIEKNL